MDSLIQDLTVQVPVWQTVLDSLDAGVAIVDGEARILAVNAAWRRLVSCDDDCSAKSCQPAGCLKCDDTPTLAAGIRGVLNGDGREFRLNCVQGGAGTRRSYLVHATRCTAPGPGYAVLTLERLSAPRAAHLELRRKVDDLVRAESFESDRGRILELVARNEPLDRVLAEIAGMVERQVPGSSCAIAALRGGEFELVAAHGLGETSETLKAAAAEAVAAAGFATPSLAGLGNAVNGAGKPPSLFPKLICGADGELHGVLLIAGAGAAWECGRVRVPARAASLAAIAMDHARMHQRLSLQELHDPLTGLPNRTLFQDRLRQAIESCRPGTGFAVAIVDLDRFRRVSDLHGPRIRDALLREVAQRLGSCLTPRDSMARSNADEFLILLQAPENALELARIAVRLGAVFSSPMRSGGSEFQLSCTIGVSRFPHDGADAAELLRNAGTALYEARQTGRGNWRLFEPAMGALARESVEIERRLREDLAAGEFELHYQPQFDSSRRRVGFEALMRWHNPWLGSVPPSRFIPVAEQSGLIVPLGAWALREACRQSVAWRRAGLGAVRIAVNISTLQLVRPEFADSVAATLAETGMDPSLLELEVTETAMMRNLSHAVEQIQRLRRFGITIAVDDFGTGYSSLGYIRNLPADAVKIDRCFVADLDKGSQDCDAIVRAIVSLAHSLGLRVVAEGVETEGQFRALAALRCDLFQGFLLGRPAPARQVEDMLQAAEPLSPWLMNGDILAPEASS